MDKAEGMDDKTKKKKKNKKKNKKIKIKKKKKKKKKNEIQTNNQQKFTDDSGIVLQPGVLSVRKEAL
jgi:hypothetical protein